MNLIPLLLAAAFAAADSDLPPPDPAPVAEPPAGGQDAAPEAVTPAPPLPPPGRQLLSLAGGARWLTFDGIPVTAGGVQAGLLVLAAPHPDGRARFGLGLFVDATWGRTENGLRTSTLVAGPRLLVAGARGRAGAGLEVGTTSIRRATDLGWEYLATLLLRAELGADLWSFGSTTVFAAVDGTLGGANDVPIKGLGARLGVRL